MSVSAPTRITPIGRITPFRAQRIWEKNYYAYRRLWKVIFSGFFEPVFYLLSLGIGMGALVGEVVLPGGQQVVELGLVEHRDPELLGLGHLGGARLGAHDQRGRLPRHAAGRLAAPVGDGFTVVERHQTILETLRDQVVSQHLPLGERVRSGDDRDVAIVRGKSRQSRGELLPA